jgi:hypothetical protein
MSRHLITLAAALLPPSRRAWGLAMRAEYDALPGRQSAFAWGCLGVSLRENVTTGEGWARMGFGVVVVLAFLLGTSCLAGLMVIVTYPPKHLFLVITSLLATFGLFVIIALLGHTAVKAMQAPTDRFHLAKIGLKTAPKVMSIFGLTSVVAMIGRAYFHAFLMPPWLGVGEAKFFLLNDAVCCLVILGVGISSRKGSKAMLASGLLGAVTLVLIGVLAYYFDRKELEGLFIPSDQQVVLLLFFALSGTILMWMERPAKAVG